MLLLEDPGGEPPNRLLGALLEIRLLLSLAVEAPVSPGLARILHWQPPEVRGGVDARRDHSKRSSHARAHDRAALRAADVLALFARGIQSGAEHVPRGRLQVACPAQIGLAQADLAGLGDRD